MKTCAFIALRSFIVPALLLALTGCDAKSTPSNQNTSGAPNPPAAQPQSQISTPAAQADPPAVPNPQALQWPRFYATNGFEFAVYQPQISSWPSNQLNGRFVVAIRPA